VVFPALRALVPPQEFADLGRHFADLGRHFADLEHQQFGRDEFTAMVGRITAIERALGIYDLNQFTPDITLYQAQVVFRVRFGAVSVEFFPLPCGPGRAN
jgi:hypothetical protein